MWSESYGANALNQCLSLSYCMFHVKYGEDKKFVKFFWKANLPFIPQVSKWKICVQREIKAKFPCEIKMQSDLNGFYDLYTFYDYYFVYCIRTHYECDTQIEINRWCYKVDAKNVLESQKRLLIFSILNVHAISAHKCAACYSNSKWKRKMVRPNTIDVQRSRILFDFF